MRAKGLPRFIWQYPGDRNSGESSLTAAWMAAEAAAHTITLRTVAMQQLKLKQLQESVEVRGGRGRRFLWLCGTSRRLPALHCPLPLLGQSLLSCDACE